MMRNKFLLIIAASFVLSSCMNFFSDADNTNASQESEKEAADSYAFQLIKDSTIEIITPDSISNEYSKATVLDDKYLYGVNRYSNVNKINVFDIEKSVFINSISVPDFLFSSYGIGNLIVDSRDSIFIQLDPAMRTVLINSSGNIINSFKDNYNLDSLGSSLVGDKFHGYDFALFASYSQPCFNKEREELYVVFRILGSNQVVGLDPLPRIGVLDLKTKEWVRFIAPLEEDMSNFESYRYDYEFSIPYLQVVDNKVFVSYPMNSFIYVYDALSCELLCVKEVRPTQQEELTAPINPKYITDQQKLRNFRASTNFYGPLLYHQKLNLFTRIFYYTLPTFLDNGKLNDGLARESVVLILDDTLATVGERYFEAGEFITSYTICTGDGFLRKVVSKYENRLVFENFRIVTHEK